MVWIINGLYCKLLNQVPRHQQIVSRILGAEYAPLITKTIGSLEILMAIWIISRIKPRACALTQLLLVLIMNVLEFILAPDLLLFGRANLLLALIFMFAIWLHEFSIAKHSSGNTA